VGPKSGSKSVMAILSSGSSQTPRTYYSSFCCASDGSHGDELSDTSTLPERDDLCSLSLG